MGTVYLILVASLAAPPASNDDSAVVPPFVFEDTVLPPLEWNPEYGDFSTAEWVITGVAGAVGLAHLALGPREGGPSGGWWFDEPVRDVLRASNETGRRIARDASDVLLALTSSYPFVIDALVVAGWHRQSPEAARMMGLINLEAMAISLSLTSVIKSWVSRERPYARTCGGQLPEDIQYCDGRRRDYSFLSGHTSQAFTAAALICSHHANLDLYTNRAADVAVCAIGLGLATTTGVLRIVGDQHYATDVLAGAAVGAASGFLVPWLLHYRHGTEPEPTTTGVDLAVVPMGLGVGLVGVW